MICIKGEGGFERKISADYRVTSFAVRIILRTPRVIHLT